MVRGTVPPGIAGGVGYCGTELDEDSQTVMSAGISVEVTDSGVIELVDDSGADMRSARVSVDVTGDTDMLSLMGLLVSMLRSAGS